MSRLSITSLFGPGGPTYDALTGDRKTAYRKQWITTLAIAALAIVILLVIFVVQGAGSEFTFAKSGQVAMTALAVLLALQFLHAFARKETVWQLRRREWQANAQRSASSKNNLLKFAAELQQKGQK